MTRGQERFVVGQEVGQEYDLRFHEPPTPSFTFTNTNGWAMRLHFDPHRVELNPAVPLDDAARLFWNRVAAVVGQDPIFPEPA